MQEDVALPLLVLVAQQRNWCVFRPTASVNSCAKYSLVFKEAANFHLKLTGILFDKTQVVPVFTDSQCTNRYQDTLIAYVQFLAKSVSGDDTTF